MTRRYKKSIITVLILIYMNTQAAYGGVVNMDINGSSVETLEILFLLTIIALLPSILIMMSCFTRIIIVLSFLKNH